MEKSLLAAALLAATSLIFASAVDLSELKNGYFVLVEGGTFMSTSAAANPDSYKLHEEKVYDFLIARYEVTVGLYEKVMGKNPTSSSDKNRPVENISDYDCVDFCNALRRLDGLDECYFEKDGKWFCDFSKNGYRLPTLPEWEYAARGGKNSSDLNIREAII